MAITLDRDVDGLCVPARAEPARNRYEDDAVTVAEGKQPTGLVVDVDPRTRALAIWPGLDRRKLTRTCGDPHRVARLVERRTALPRESILRLLGVRSIEE